MKKLITIFTIAIVGSSVVGQDLAKLTERSSDINFEEKKTSVPAAQHYLSRIYSEHLVLANAENREWHNNVEVMNQFNQKRTVWLRNHETGNMNKQESQEARRDNYRDLWMSLMDSKLDDATLAYNNLFLFYQPKIDRSLENDKMKRVSKLQTKWDCKLLKLNYHFYHRKHRKANEDRTLAVK